MLWPSSGDLSESELLVRSLRGLESCLSFMGVLTRFCLGVWPPSSLQGEKGAVFSIHTERHGLPFVCVCFSFSLGRLVTVVMAWPGFHFYCSSGAYGVSPPLRL